MFESEAEVAVNNDRSSLMINKKAEYLCTGSVNADLIDSSFKSYLTFFMFSMFVIFPKSLQYEAFRKS